MATQGKPKLPRKYRQARAAGKPAAKAAFPGKKRAARRDPMAKYSAEDRQVFNEISKESKGNYITDDKGNKIRVKPTETAKERFARERAEVRRMFQEEPMDEAKQKSRAERMAAKRAEIIKKNEAAKAARAGKFVPTLQQTPANEKPLSKPVKTTKKVGTVGTTKKPDAKGVAKVVEEAKKIQATKKPTVKIPTVKTGYAAGKELNAEGKAIYDKLIKEGVKPKSALNKALFRQEKGAKVAAKAATPVAEAAKEAATAVKKQGPVKVPANAKPVATATVKNGKLSFKFDEKQVKDIVEKNKAGRSVKPTPAVSKETPTTKRPTLEDLKKNEAKYLAEKNKALANSAKGKTQTPQAKEAKAKAAAKPEGKVAGKPKFSKIKKVGKAGVYGAVAGELVSLAKGSTKKDFKEIGRLEGKLSDITGKGKSGATAARQGAQQQLSQLASLATMGIVGKTRRQRMDELNNLIAKAQLQQKPKELRYGSKGESLVPGTKAYEQGSTTRPTSPTVNAGGATTTSSSKYTVKKGDTLYGIAKTSGVSLKELRDANPDIMKKKKYKQGAMIWSGTKVNIPKKK